MAGSDDILIRARDARDKRRETSERQRRAKAAYKKKIRDGATQKPQGSWRSKS
jgi:hypothetical protein